MSDRPGDADTTADPTAARVEPVAADALADDVSAASFGGYVRLWWQGIRAGELGSLPIIVGLVVIAVVFGILDDTFLTERNFTNLLLQMSAIATIRTAAHRCAAASVSPSPSGSGTNSLAAM